MGCFNYTCAISHAPIRPNDKVRLFFIASNTTRFGDKNYTFNGFQLEPYDAFKVIGGISLKSSYLDYGDFDFGIDGSIYAKHILSIIKKNYITQTENDLKKSIFMKEYINIQKENLSFDHVMNMVHHGCLYIKSEYGDDTLIVNVMAVHEEIYNMMCKEIGDSGEEAQNEDYAYKKINPYKELMTLTKSDDSDKKIYKRYKQDQSFNLSMMIYGYMYQPMVTGNQNYEFNNAYNLLLNMSEILMKKQSKDSSAFDTKLKTKICIKKWQEIKLSELKEQLLEEYEESDEEYSDFIKALKASFKKSGTPSNIIIKASELMKDKYDILSELLNNNDIDLSIIVDIEF